MYLSYPHQTVWFIFQDFNFKYKQKSFLCLAEISAEIRRGLVYIRVYPTRLISAEILGDRKFAFVYI